MPKESAENVKEKAVKAALKLATDQEWNNVTLEAIAATLKMPVEELRGYFGDTTDILIELGKMIDDKVMENTGAQESDISPRDRLFDIMMERFDILNEYREGLTAILQSFRCDPKQAVISAPHICRSMGKMLDSAGINTEGLHGVAKIAGLTGLYLKTLHIWIDDNTADMAKTMAELDKNLGYAEKAVGKLGI